MNVLTFSTNSNAFNCSKVSADPSSLIMLLNMPCSLQIENALGLVLDNCAKRSNILNRSVSSF